MRAHHRAPFGAAFPAGFGPEFDQEMEDPRGPGGRGGKDGRGRGPGLGPGFGGRGGPFGPRGRGRGAAPEAPDASDAAGWFTGRLPSDWFVGTPDVAVDREEVLIVGELPPLETAGIDQDAAATAAAESGRIARFREETREARIEIARQGQFRYGREISWGARLGGTEELFTTASVPVMTRLRQPERQIPFRRAGLGDPPGRRARGLLARRTPLGNGRGQPGADRGPRPQRVTIRKTAT